jgi:hypothetical protein
MRLRGKYTIKTIKMQASDNIFRFIFSHLHKNDFAVCHKTKNKERGIVRLQDAIHSIEKAPSEIKLIHFRV